jgi:transketolase
LNIGEDGVSAQILADIALMRVLPNMEVVSPIDYNQTKSALTNVITRENPKYFRVTRAKFPVFTKPKAEYKFGQAQILREGSDLTVVTTGSVGYEALKTVETLEQQNISAELINIHTIKPLDTEAISKSIQKTGKLVVIEEHYRAGGLGSAILEELTHVKEFKSLLLGVDDQFGESGPGKEVMKKYGLHRDTYVSKIKEFLEN